jgi:hypothetical protein
LFINQILITEINIATDYKPNIKPKNNWNAFIKPAEACNGPLMLLLLPKTNLSKI